MGFSKINLLCIIVIQLANSIIYKSRMRMKLDVGFNFIKIILDAVHFTYF